MSIQFHENGLATLWGYGVTTAATWSPVGYSVDGVTIDLTYETEDVFTDKTGPKIPEDVLDYGQWASVKMQLIKYDTDALQGLEDRLYDQSGENPGDLPNVESPGGPLLIGTLMGQCKQTIPIAITRGNNVGCEQAPVEGGFQFNGAYLAGNDSFKIGTRVTIHDLTFRCLPDSSGVLYVELGSGGPIAPVLGLW